MVSGGRCAGAGDHYAIQGKRQRIVLLPDEYFFPFPFHAPAGRTQLALHTPRLNNK
jgi:hypothetical protein